MHISKKRFRLRGWNTYLYRFAAFDGISILAMQLSNVYRLSSRVNTLRTYNRMYS